MKEITRIITIEITDIRTVEDSELDSVLAERDTLAETVKKELPGVLDVDDATLVKVQDFVMDITEGEGADDGKMESAE